MFRNAEYLIGLSSEADDDETSDWLLALVILNLELNVMELFRGEDKEDAVWIDDRVCVLY